MTKTYDFAGEEVKVTEMMTANSGEEIKEQESSESSKVEAKKRYTMAHMYCIPFSCHYYAQRLAF